MYKQHYVDSGFFALRKHINLEEENSGKIDKEETGGEEMGDEHVQNSQNNKKILRTQQIE